MMSADIPIKFINDTGSPIQVAVVNDHCSESDPECNYVIWHILNTQTEADFVYPARTEVGAYYYSDHVKIVMGPFPAQLGSTWEIQQEDMHGSAVLQQVTEVCTNPDNIIMVKNVAPNSWSGRKYRIGLYKTGNLLLVDSDVHVGEKASFELQPKLHFGIVRNLPVGYVFQSFQITQAHERFDLKEYPNGLKVTLKEEQGSGRYIFSGMNFEEQVDTFVPLD